MANGLSSVAADQLATFDDALPILTAAFRKLEAKSPGPTFQRVNGRLVPRYAEKSAEQAVLQKVTRYVSGLKTITVLLAQRMLQEDGVIKRTLDELEEDIMFLTHKPETEEENALYNRYVAAFYEEVFDEGVEPIDSTKRRKTIKRHEIRNYLKRLVMDGPAKGEKASPLIYHVYSGYVHSASPHLMEMLSLRNIKFDLTGINDIDLFESHVRDAANYFIRGFYVMAALASILGDGAVLMALKAQGDAWEHRWD